VPAHGNLNHLTAADAVHSAALDLLRPAEVIGGDLLLKRAHQAVIDIQTETAGLERGAALEEVAGAAPDGRLPAWLVFRRGSRNR
jgi:hypothetical protein